VLQERPVWIDRQRVHYRDARGVDVTLDDPPVEAPTVTRLQALFSERRSAIADDQRRFVAEITGVQYRRSAADLRALLEDAQRAYHHTSSLRRKIRDRVEHLGQQWLVRAQNKWARG